MSTENIAVLEQGGCYKNQPLHYSQHDISVVIHLHRWRYGLEGYE